MGLRKDNRGLFTEISHVLDNSDVEMITFDYCDFNSETSELSVFPFSANAKRLQTQIDLVLARKPDANIIIIGQSQGCIIPTLCDLSHVSQVIAISPFFHTNIQETISRYKSNFKSEINLGDITKRIRSDGTTTIIPPEYWQERFETDVVNLYNEIALKTRLTLICPLQDEIMKYTELKEIKYARIINSDGDHDFSKQYRQEIIDIVKRELIS